MGKAKGYPGSKGGEGVWQRIVSLMPVHSNYFEPFVGHGAVLLRKRPAPGANVGSDVDAGVIAWWRRRLRRPASSHLTILQECALRILTSHLTMLDPTTLVYLDPPYLRETRTRAFYNHEFDAPEQHESLLRLINRLPCMVMISGYDSALYRRELASWRVVSFNAMTRGGLRREHVWMNFPDGLPLHDVRFVGDGFRERDRIKRKRQRWKRRFELMPPAERQVIREALDAVGV